MDSLHDRDFHAWTEQQARLLRAGDLASADIERIAEEIETMGKAEKRELVSRLTILLLHLLKWRFQPSHRGPSWRASIANARDDIADHLADNPSLKPHLPAATEAAYRRARRLGAAETGLPEHDFPLDNIFTQSQTLDTDFWPE